MAYLLPVAGAFSYAVSTILEKIVLRKRKIDIKFYQTAVFFSVALLMLPFIYFFWHLDSQALQLKNVLIFSAVIVLATIANLLIFYSIKREKITNLEPANLLEPIFVILLAILFSFFFTGLYDRNPKIIVAAIVASLALLFSHIEKDHLTFNKYFIAAIFGSLFFALELVVSQLILQFYSPFTFYFLRCSFILILSLILFRPKFEKLKLNVGLEIFATGLLWVGYRVLTYYGYIYIGVIFTTLLLMLGPLFIYVLAYFILKERISLRNFIAAIVILASIVYTLI